MINNQKCLYFQAAFMPLERLCGVLNIDIVIAHVASIIMSLVKCSLKLNIILAS